MPAIELGPADYLGVWGRLQIILRGGNRGVVAVTLDNRRMSYGDLRSICLIGAGRGDG